MNSSSLQPLAPSTPRGDREPNFTNIMEQAVVVRANAVLHAALKSGKITLTNPTHTVQKVTQEVVAEGTAQRAVAAKSKCYIPRMDLLNDPDRNVYVAFFELPGVKYTDLELTVDANLLIIRGVRRWRLPPPKNVTRAGLHNFLPIHEIRYGQFHRTVPLPPGTKRTDLAAFMENGTLVITWPKPADPSGPGDVGSFRAASPMPNDPASVLHQMETAD